MKRRRKKENRQIESTINPKFEAHYLRHIKPKEAEFEIHRRKLLKQYNSRLKIVSIIGVVVIILGVLAHLGGLVNLSPFNTNEDLAENIKLWILLAAIAGGYYWVSAPSRCYTSKVKGEIFPEIFKFFGKSFTYTEKASVNLKELGSNSDILPKFTDHESSDHVKGRISDVDIELFEATLIERIVKRRNGKRETKSKIRFQGVMIMLSMNKNFSGKTLVRQDKGAIMNAFKGKFSEKYDNVQLEDPVFEKEFETYSSDQVEARYLLTPTFMERLLSLSGIFDGTSECSFFDNKLLIKIETEKDFFKVSSLRKPVNFTYDINLILKEMKNVLSIIKILQLDKRLGL